MVNALVSNTVTHTHLSLEPGLSGSSTIDGSNFDEIVAKCLHTISFWS